MRLTIGRADERPDPRSDSLLQTWYAGGTGAAVAQAFASNGRFLIAFRGIGLFAFPPGSTDITVWLDDGVSTEQLHDVAFRQVRPIVLQACGWQATHASANWTSDGILLMCGRAHSGKSTLAYALAQRGFPQLADDQFVWRPGPSGFERHPLPFTPRLRPPSLTFFNTSSPSAVVESRLEGPIWRIVILERHEEDFVPSLAAVPSQRAFSALLGFAHCFNPKDQAETARLMRDYLELVGRVPVYALRYPTGFDHFERVIELLVSGSAPASPRLASGTLA